MAYGENEMMMRVAISHAVDSINDQGAFAAMMGTVMKKWTYDRGIDMIEFMENLLDSVRHAEEITREDFE